jgi:hypothetical protein
METWKSINGYESLYEVSEYGKVRSFDNIRVSKNGSQKLYKGKILKGVVNSVGYLCYDLFNNGIRKNTKAHFLVASEFISERPLKMVINHKDGDKINNHFSNLEWISQKENCIHAFKKGLIIRKGFDIIDLNTGIFYVSIGEAHRTGLIKWSLPQFKKMINKKTTNTTQFVRI